MPVPLAFTALALLVGPACGGRDAALPPQPPPLPAAAAPAPPAEPPAPVAATPPPAAAPAAPDSWAPTPPTAERAEAFAARRPKSVVELQPWREETQVPLPTGQGPATTVTLVDLNPAVHEWFLVRLEAAGQPAQTWHLENHDPRAVRVTLDPAFPEGLTLHEGATIRTCPLWPPTGSALELGRASGQAFAPLCEGRLSLRSPTQGHRSTREATVDFLRDKVWGGEQITNLVKETLYQDSELATSEVLAAAPGSPSPAAAGASPGPTPARVDPALAGRQVVPVNLGLPLLEAASGTVEIGRWYPVEGSPGVFASAMQPRLVDPAVSAGWEGRVHALDEVEGSALVFLTAFDLDTHELVFDVGTDHPRVGWSERAPAAVRDLRLPGPDGFDTLAPLVRTGKVNPAHVPRLVATFTGGFKRSHGAFKSGPFSLVNSGTHYGWVEHGVIESRPMPGLATWVAWADPRGGPDRVEVRTWSVEDDARLQQVRHLRQNGPPILEPSGEGGAAMPGALVNRWGDGNWSGSVEGKLRSVRASLCVQESAQGRYLLYGYFSSATPSGMARVLAAYGCGVAMLTDMNALEHTYLSLHHFHDGRYAVHHLITGMEVLDRTNKAGVYLPRFVGLADNRDFFTVLRRRPVEEDR
ncbi:hypothetical protein L6R53_15000 [Myxococcota bacterium]|nr:hypothetical protein [Myxococcota bacterium]